TSFFCLAPPATTVISSLSLHDALPISRLGLGRRDDARRAGSGAPPRLPRGHALGQRSQPGDDRADGRGGGRSAPVRRAELRRRRSEEHTSELQSRENLVCRLLLEKKKK